MFNMWAGDYQPFVLHEWSHNWETDTFGNVLPEDTDDSFFRLMHLSDPPYPMTIADASGVMIANRLIEDVPEQAKYTTALEISTDDPTRMTDEYVFLPSLRRSLRLSKTSRCSPILGTDYLADDADWKPGFFKPVFYGIKKILLAVEKEEYGYKEESRFNYVGGDYKTGAEFPGWPKPGKNQWEVRDTYVINLVLLPVLGHGYCYTQRIFYVDKQLWFPFYQENYDRNGKVYHLLWVINSPSTFKGERTIWVRFAFSIGADLQNGHASPDIGYNLGIDDEVPMRYREAGISPGGLSRIMK